MLWKVFNVRIINISDIPFKTNVKRGFQLYIHRKIKQSNSIYIHPELNNPYISKNPLQKRDVFLCCWKNIDFSRWSLQYMLLHVFHLTVERWSMFKMPARKDKDRQINWDQNNNCHFPCHSQHLITITQLCVDCDSILFHS